MPFGTGMPGRPREHVLEEQSLIALRTLLPAEWTLEPVRRDYGLDARVELFQDGQATGRAFWCQLKATDDTDLRGALRVGFATTSLNYLSVQADPVLLVRYHAPSDRLFGTWLHRHDIRLKRAGQKTATVRWRLPEELGPASPDALAEEVRRHRRIGSPASLPLTVHVDATGLTGTLRASVLALLRTTLVAAGGHLTLVAGPSADLCMTIASTKIRVDTPLSTLRAETVQSDQPLAVADDAAAALAVALGALGLPAAAVDLVLRCSGARLLRNDDTAGRLAQAFGSAGRWREASDLSLDCLSGSPERELLGRLLEFEVLTAASEPSESDARHIAANLAELASRQRQAGENPGAAWYSAGNWLFHTVGDYPAALRAYEAAAEARPDYRTQDYWLQETAAALFETGDYATAAAMYGQAEAVATGPAPGLLARTADCLAHAGDPEQARLLLERYQRDEPHPEAPWILMLLALRQLSAAVGTDGTTVEQPSVHAEQHGNGSEDADAAGAPWHDWPGLVHTGLGLVEDLAALNRAAARGDVTAFLAVLTAGCAFPAPDEPEPWAALLLLSWALVEDHSADWTLAGEVFDAALDTAVHRRGDALLRDLLAAGDQPAGLLAQVEGRVAEAAAADRRLLIRVVSADGVRDSLEIGYGTQRH